MNLNDKNIQEYGWDRSKMREAKNKYKTVRLQVRKALSIKSNEINIQYYSNFKKDFIGNFPSFAGIINYIEKEV